MLIENLKQPSHNATLMGMLRGVADYYDIELSDGMLYGGSGQAFLMNIHKDLCPSGPYCWNRKPFYRLLRNLGIDMIDHGFFGGDSGITDRASVEQMLVSSMDKGVPCGLVNMEYQLIPGYDDTGLLTAQPWPCLDFPPAHLTFGTWAELGEGVHMNFFTFHKLSPEPESKTIADILRYAVDLYRNPAEHTSPDYSVGPRAYANWIGAVEKGHGSSHGNWWNATVWSECRAKAADYFTEIAVKHPALAQPATALADDYRAIADALAKASDKEMPAPDKIALLEETAAREARCIECISDSVEHVEV